jgi:hypothetical protein
VTSSTRQAVPGDEASTGPDPGLARSGEKAASAGRRSQSRSLTGAVHPKSQPRRRRGDDVGPSGLRCAAGRFPPPSGFRAGPITPVKSGT